MRLLHYVQKVDIQMEEGPDKVELVSSLSKDLERRDFTINAMAIDVARRVLHDPHNGRLDLKKGVIKSVGIPTQRIKEDGLRILRAYRFMDRGDNGVWLYEPRPFHFNKKSI